MADLPENLTEPQKPLPKDEERAVFDKAQNDLPWPQEDTLNADDEGNVLPGNDPLDEDPNDNGDQEQFDPEDMDRKRALGVPLKP